MGDNDNFDSQGPSLSPIQPRFLSISDESTLEDVLESTLIEPRLAYLQQLQDRTIQVERKCPNGIHRTLLSIVHRRSIDNLSPTELTEALQFLRQAAGVTTDSDASLVAIGEEWHTLEEMDNQTRRDWEPETAKVLERINGVSPNARMVAIQMWTMPVDSVHSSSNSPEVIDSILELPTDVHHCVALLQDRNSGPYSAATVQLLCQSLGASSSISRSNRATSTRNSPVGPILEIDGTRIPLEILIKWWQSLALDLSDSSHMGPLVFCVNTGQYGGCDSVWHVVQMDFTHKVMTVYSPYSWPHSSDLIKLLQPLTVKLETGDETTHRDWIFRSEIQNPPCDPALAISLSGISSVHLVHGLLLHHTRPDRDVPSRSSNSSYTPYLPYRNRSSSSFNTSSNSTEQWILDTRLKHLRLVTDTWDLGLNLIQRLETVDLLGMKPHVGI